MAGMSSDEFGGPARSEPGPADSGEFASLTEVAAELGLDATSVPPVARRTVDLPGTQQLSLLAWGAQQRGTVQLTRGSRAFADRQEMIDAAIAASAQRPASAVRRGVIHNSRRLPDGSWGWRYDRPDPDLPFPAAELWDDLARLRMPSMLVTGGESGFVTAADRAEIVRRVPAIRVETVARAGHAVQSDQPAILAALIADFVPARPSK
jgi:pimeloyl-ACP methyl ester carboxylesterase